MAGSKPMRTEFGICQRLENRCAGESVRNVLVTIPGLAVTTVLILALTTVPAVVSEGQGGGGVKGTMIVLPEGASVDDVFDPVTDNAVQDIGYAYNIEENISTLIHWKGAEILFFSHMG